MGIHMALYFASVTPAVTATYGSVTAVVDQVLGYRNGGHVPGKPMSLVALAAAGSADGGNLASARVQSPKTLVSPVYLRPVNATESFPDNPNVSSFAGQPVMMRVGEEITASAWAESGAGAVAPNIVIVAWLCDRHEPLPTAESYWVPFTVSLTGMVGQKWQTAAISFGGPPTLPAGRYAILGMHLVRSSSADDPLCGRLVIPGETLRPGMITSPGFSAITPVIASDGSLGVWGYFDAQLPPSLEVFSGGAPSGTLNGFLRVAQVDR